MGGHNDRLRRARERTESPYASGDCLSRQELAELVNTWVYEHTEDHRVIELDANYIGKLEQGTIYWPRDPDRRTGFRAVLGVETDAELGFRRPRRSSTIVVGVDRHEFIRVGLRVGATAVAGPSALAALLPGQPTHVPSVVGRSHVAGVRAAAVVFEGWDDRHGGGMLRAAVTAQLRHCAELLGARCSEQVRPELFSAVGYLGNVTAFMAFDAYAHDDARCTFGFALSCAEEAGDWHLRAMVLSAMARQAIWCGDPDTGLTFTELALVRADRLTATERAVLHTIRAWALGKLGRVQDAVTAAGLADEEFGYSRPAEDPEWMAYYDAAKHSGDVGRALWEVAVHGQFITETRERLTAAVGGYSDGFTRSRAMSQTKLASLVMVTGNPREAAALGGQALGWAGSLRSHRAIDDLRELRRFSEYHPSLPEVAELSHRIGTVVAAS